ncbi:MAG: hypothetical protein IH571_07395 [Acholeplasmataceae bacterium]|nr:hypothetical protein [Acholeplasmataceae bacterium]
MRKILSLISIIVMVFVLFACQTGPETGTIVCQGGHVNGSWTYTQGKVTGSFTLFGSSTDTDIKENENLLNQLIRAKSFQSIREAKIFIEDEAETYVNTYISPSYFYCNIE